MSSVFNELSPRSSIGSWHVAPINQFFPEQNKNGNSRADVTFKQKW